MDARAFAAPKRLRPRRRAWPAHAALVPRTQRHKRVYARLRRAMAPFFTAWCAAEPGPYRARSSLRSRFCEAALRKSCALHRARETTICVIAGLDPAIHLLGKTRAKMDARVKPAHDAE